MFNILHILNIFQDLLPVPVFKISASRALDEKASNLSPNRQFRAVSLRVLGFKFHWRLEMTLQTQDVHWQQF